MSCACNPFIQQLYQTVMRIVLQALRTVLVLQTWLPQCLPCKSMLSWAGKHGRTLHGYWSAPVHHPLKSHLKFLLKAGPCTAGWKRMAPAERTAAELNRSGPLLNAMARHRRLEVAMLREDWL